MTCAREVSVAAYVLDTLEAPERAHMAEHLAQCPPCQARLEQVAELPALLARVPLAVAASGVPRPEQRLLDRVLAGASAEVAHRRRRRRVFAAAAAAALVLGGAGAALVSQHELSPRDTTTVAGKQGPVQASVELTPAPDGTDLALVLSGVDPGQECRLVALTADGTSQIAATWHVGYTGQVTIRGHTAFDAGVIDRLVVETLDHRTLVELTTSG